MTLHVWFFGLLVAWTDSVEGRCDESSDRDGLVRWKNGKLGEEEVSHNEKNGDRSTR